MGEENQSAATPVQKKRKSSLLNRCPFPLHSTNGPSQLNCGESTHTDVVLKNLITLCGRILKHPAKVSATFLGRLKQDDSSENTQTFERRGGE